MCAFVELFPLGICFWTPSQPCFGQRDERRQAQEERGRPDGCRAQGQEVRNSTLEEESASLRGNGVQKLYSTVL